MCNPKLTEQSCPVHFPMYQIRPKYRKTQIIIDAWIDFGPPNLMAEFLYIKGSNKYVILKHRSHDDYLWMLQLPQ